MNRVQIEANCLETKETDNQSKTDTTVHDENSIENDLLQSINTASQQGFNCVDLSKKNIKEFPTQLLEFSTLRYLYLEGNQLTELPNELFNRLPRLKWLDLRNNQLKSIPNDGLANHNSLQYLLLSGNLLETLPFELGQVKNLSALNLDGNPLISPPLSIVKRGIKIIQKYLRDEFTSDKSSDDNQNEIIFPKEQISVDTKPYNRKSKSQTDYFYHTISINPLPRHLQSCMQCRRVNYSPTRPPSFIRSRPQSEIKFSQIKKNLITNRHNSSDEETEMNERQSLMHMKHRNLEDEQQTQLFRQKTPMTNFEEPIISTPFHIDSRYIQTLNKDLRRRNYSPEIFLKDDEIRRQRDQQIQDRIRRITDRMLRRRLEARENPLIEKRQIQFELRELHRLESAGKQYSPIEINRRFKTFNNNTKSRKKL